VAKRSPGMFDSPFLYLSACSIKNRVLKRMRRLREPRYLIGAVVGVAYLYLAFFRRVRFRRGTAARSIAFPPEVLGAIQLASGFVLWLVVAARWIIPVPTQPLKLSGAERDFLLTAPVTRRRITRYKLLRSQIAVFLSTALMLVFAWNAVNSRWAFLLGMFLLFTTLRMHLLGVALSRTMLRRAAGRPDPATIAAIAVIAVASAGALLALAPGVLAFARTRDLATALLTVRDTASRPVTAVALLPFTLLVRPVFAAGPGAFLVAAWPAVVLALVNYAWVVQCEERAEKSEATSEQQTVEGKRSLPRPVYRRAPFALAAHGRPEWALVWKNLIMLGRHANPAMLLRVAVPLLIMAFVVAGGHQQRLAAAAFPFAIVISCGLTLLGPYSFRNDLRQDLACLAVLKTWPVSGERLLWGEVLAPTIVLTAIVWVCILLTAVLVLAAPPTALGWPAWLAIAASAAIVLPTVILAQVVVQNAAVVLFPGWVVTGPSRPRGVEAMGQQMLMFGGSLLLLLVGILPGAVVGGLVTLVAFYLVGWLAIFPGAAALAGLIIAEIVLVLRLLGGVLDRTDPSAVDTA